MGGWGCGGILASNIEGDGVHVVTLQADTFQTPHVMMRLESIT